MRQAPGPVPSLELRDFILGGLTAWSLKAQNFLRGCSSMRLFPWGTRDLGWPPECPQGPPGVFFEAALGHGRGAAVHPDAGNTCWRAGLCTCGDPQLHLLSHRRRRRWLPPRKRRLRERTRYTQRAAPVGGGRCRGRGPFRAPTWLPHHPPSLGSRAPASASRTPSALAVCSPSTRLAGAQVLHPHTFVQVQGSSSGR